MKFLADMGVSTSTVQWLSGLGYDTVHIATLGLPRATDATIFQLALEQDRVVLTFDLDFVDLVAAGRSFLPSVIVFRLRDQTPLAVAPRLQQVLEEQEEALVAGALIMVETSRYRLRRLPIS